MNTLVELYVLCAALAVVIGAAVLLLACVMINAVPVLDAQDENERDAHV